MFIHLAYRYLHEAWRYIVGFFVIFIIWQLGSIPFMVGVVAKAISDGGDALSVLEDPNAIMSVLDSNLTLFLMLLSFVIGFIGLYLWVKYVHKQPLLRVTTTRKKVHWGRFWFGFLLVAVFTIATTLLDYFYFSPDTYEVQFNLKPFIILAVIAIVMVPLQTSFEEYLFRGYLMQGFGVVSTHKSFPLIFLFIHVWIALLILLDIYSGLSMLFNMLFLTVGVVIVFFMALTNMFDFVYDSASYQPLKRFFSRKFTPLYVTSMIFGMLHFFNPEVDQLGPLIMIYYIGTGVFLGLMTLMDEGMELALGFHAGNNLIAALLVTADWTAFQTHSIFKDVSDPTMSWYVLLPVLVIYPIFLLLMAWRYKWKNWGNRLAGRIQAPPNDSIVEIGNE